MTYQQRLSEIKNGLRPKECVPKTKKPLKKISDRKKKEMAMSGDDALDNFFEEMKDFLEGKCTFCNGRTTWKHKDLWRIAIAHLLPKAKFKSVATNANNWTELCWNCHMDFDSGKISWEMLYDSHEWLMLRSQLEIVLMCVSEDEKKHKPYSKLLELVYKTKQQ